MAANNGQITRFQGDSFQLQFPLYAASGAPLPLVSPVAYFRLCADQTPASQVAIAKDSALVGGVVIDQETIAGITTWVATVSFAIADTINLSVGAHYYSLRVVDGTYAETLGFGTILIKQALP